MTDSQGLYQQFTVTLMTDDPLDVPDLPEVRALLDQLQKSLLSGNPGRTVLMGRPLTAATLAITQPLKPEFCPSCGIDLLTNPGALVVDRNPLALEVAVRCDCPGRSRTTFPLWFWQ